MEKEKDYKEISLTLKQKNMFYKKPRQIEYLDDNLTRFGNTCLSYKYVEKYSVEKIQEDLAELGFNCQIKVDPELSPDNIYGYEYDHNRRVRMVSQILPIVIIYWDDYEGPGWNVW